MELWMSKFAFKLLVAVIQVKCIAFSEISDWLPVWWELREKADLVLLGSPCCFFVLLYTVDWTYPVHGICLLPNQWLWRFLLFVCCMLFVTHRFGMFLGIQLFMKWRGVHWFKGGTETVKICSVRHLASNWRTCQRVTSTSPSVTTALCLQICHLHYCL